MLWKRNVRQSMMVKPKATPQKQHAQKSRVLKSKFNLRQEMSLFGNLTDRPGWGAADSLSDRLPAFRWFPAGLERAAESSFPSISAGSLRQRRKLGGHGSLVNEQVIQYSLCWV